MDDKANFIWYNFSWGQKKRVRMKKLYPNSASVCLRGITICKEDRSLEEVGVL